MLVGHTGKSQLTHSSRSKLVNYSMIIVKNILLKDVTIRPSLTPHVIITFTKCL